LQDLPTDTMCPDLLEQSLDRYLVEGLGKIQVDD
jgi:hypothetical protein